MFVHEQTENIVGKGENAGYQYFLLYPHCFQRPSSPELGSLKFTIVLKQKGQGEQVNKDHNIIDLCILYCTELAPTALHYRQNDPLSTDNCTKREPYFFLMIQVHLCNEPKETTKCNPFIGYVTTGLLFV